MILYVSIQRNWSQVRAYRQGRRHACDDICAKKMNNLNAACWVHRPSQVLLLASWQP